MHPSCLEAHATRSPESGDRARWNPPTPSQHPLTPATVPGSPAVPYSEYAHAHETKEEKRKKGPRVPRKIKKTKNCCKGPARNQRRRFRSGNSERPGMYQPSTLRIKALRSASGLRRPLRSLRKEKFTKLLCKAGRGSSLNIRFL